MGHHGYIHKCNAHVPLFYISIGVCITHLVPDQLVAAYHLTFSTSSWLLRIEEGCRVNWASMWSLTGA